MRIWIVNLAAVALFLSGVPALADDNDIPPQPLPRNAEDVNFTGTWSYSTFNHEVAGQCPPARPMAGTLSITQDDALAQVLMVSGAICNPDFSCVYSGVIEGGDLLVANSGIVDGEGGKVTNELRLYFYSDVSAGAESTSVYTHPGGFACQWSHNLQLTRPES